MNTMQFLTAILNWLQADPVHASAAAMLVVSLTPTPNPATPWGKVYKIIELIGLNFGHAKETGLNAASIADEVAALIAKQTPPAPTPAPAAPAAATVPVVVAPAPLANNPQ